MCIICVCIYVCVHTGPGVAVSELSDAESPGNGYDHTPFQESAADSFFLPTT